MSEINHLVKENIKQLWHLATLKTPNIRVMDMYKTREYKTHGYRINFMKSIKKKLFTVISNVNSILSLFPL